MKSVATVVAICVCVCVWYKANTYQQRCMQTAMMFEKGISGLEDGRKGGGTGGRYR